MVESMAVHDETQDRLACGGISELVGILDQYLADLNAGKAPDRRALLAQHPQLADQLERCLAGIDFIHAADREPENAPRQLGDFRIVRELGRGGMGVVYEAEQVSLKRKVALKVLRFGAVADREAMERFQREAETVAGLHHTNVVPIFAVGHEHGVAYYAMQFIRGKSLDEELKKQRAGGPPLNALEIARWGLQAAEALAHAHERGVIHRDVKPSNLIRDEDGRIWLADFGLAKRLDDVTLSVTGAILGTPRYMSPEQASAARWPIDARTDIYSLGASLYELGTGQPVFDADSAYGIITQILTEEPRPPRRIRPDLPRDFETVILCCLAKEPAQRYASAQALADDLRAVIEKRPIKSRRAGWLERTSRWVRKHRTPVTAAALSATFAALLLIAGYLSWNRYQQLHQGPVYLLTEGQPLAAELLDSEDRVVREFTVPLQKPLRVPWGRYQLRLSGRDRVSVSYQVNVASAGVQGNLALEPRRLWDDILMQPGGSVHLIELDQRPSLVVADGDTVRRLDGANATPVWTVPMTFDRDSAVPPLKRFAVSQLATAQLVRPAPDLDGDGTADLVWIWLGGAGPNERRGSLLTMSGKDGQVLWTYRASDAPQAALPPHLTGVMLPCLPLVVDVDGDGHPEILQPVSAQGVDISNQGTNRNDGANSVASLAQWTWVDVLDGRSGRPIRPVFSARAFHGSRIADDTEFGIALTRVNDKPTLLLTDENSVRVAGLDGEETPPVMLGFERIGKPRFLETDGPKVVVLQPEGDGRTASLVQLSIPHGEKSWEFPGVAVWSPSGNSQTITASPEWPLVEDLDRDGRPELIVATTEPGRGDAPGLSIQRVGLRHGQSAWKHRVGVPVPLTGPPRLIVGPDLDNDGHSEVLVAALTRDETVATNPAGVVIHALSGRTGGLVWQWRQEGRVEPLHANLDPLGWWQPDLDGRPQLLVTLSGVELGSPQNRQCWALSTSDGRLAHTIDFRGVGRVEPADLDRDGIRDLVLHPQLIGEAGMLRVIRGSPAEAWRYLGYCRPVPDLNGDGIAEVLDVTGDIAMNCLSGCDLQPLWKTNIGGAVVASSIPTQGDLDGDETLDLLVHGLGGFREPLSALSGKTGQILWTTRLKTVQNELFHAHFLEAQDLDGDRMPEVIYVYDHESPSRTTVGGRRQRWLAVVSGQNGGVRWKQPLTPLAEWTEIGPLFSFRPAIDQLDEDRVRDITTWIVTEAGEYAVGAWDGQHGRKLWERPLFSTRSATGRRLPVPQRMVTAMGDLNGDGKKEVIVELETGTDSPSSQRCELWSLQGSSGRVQWIWQGPMKQANAADRSDLTPMFVRRNDGNRNVAVLTASQSDDSKHATLHVVDGQGQDVASAAIDVPDARGEYSSCVRAVDLDGDGSDELLWIGDGRLHVRDGDLLRAHWDWPLPEHKGEILSVLLAGNNFPAVIAIWSGRSVYGVETTTGRLRWHCDGPGAPARQLSPHVLGATRPQGLPWVSFHESHDPTNFANTSTVCRQARPIP